MVVGATRSAEATAIAATQRGRIPASRGNGQRTVFGQCRRRGRTAVCRRRATGGRPRRGGATRTAKTPQQKLAELQSLYDQKLISQSDYQAAKTKILTQLAN